MLETIFTRKDVKENGSLDEALRVLLVPLVDDAVKGVMDRVKTVIGTISPYKDEIGKRDELIRAHRKVNEQLLASFDDVQREYNRMSMEFSRTKERLSYSNLELMRLRKVKFNEYKRELKKHKRLIREKVRLRGEIEGYNRAIAKLETHVNMRKDALNGTKFVVTELEAKIRALTEERDKIATDFDYVKKKLVNALAHNQILVEKNQELVQQKMAALEAKRNAQLEARVAKSPHGLVETSGSMAPIKLTLPGDEE